MSSVADSGGGIIAKWNPCTLVPKPFSAGGQGSGNETNPDLDDELASSIDSRDQLSTVYASRMHIPVNLIIMELGRIFVRTISETDQRICSGHELNY